jgi:uncharacterized membrane protein YbhN (UPF0104 family)
VLATESGSEEEGEVRVLALDALEHAPLAPAACAAAIILAHAVGYVLTRRTLPFAGAGIVEVLMPLTLVAAGSPLSQAVRGVITYRIFNLWLPLLPAAAALPRVRRRLGRRFELLPAS